MRLLAKPPVHTRRLLNPSLKDIAPSARAIFAADSTEARGHLAVWQELQRQAPERCTKIIAQNYDTIEVCIGEGLSEVISLRSDSDLARLVAQGELHPLYLDISGLSHHVWAPILRAALQRPAVNVVYAEPLSYRAHPTPSSPLMFDLSTAISGVAPIPGMARLASRIDDTQSILIAFLGFEGNRAQHVALSLDSVRKVIPVIGVPGFRIEFPAVAVASNRSFLDDHQCHAEIRLARASCPFEAYEVLSQIRGDYQDCHFYIAPLGTKPHALGAIRYAIENPGFTEIVYDHPVRKLNRTSGIGPVHVYSLT